MILMSGEHPEKLLELARPPFKRPRTPPCSPKFLLPEDVPCGKFFIQPARGYKGVDTLARQDMLEQVQTVSWFPHEEVSAMQLKEKMARFALPGQAAELS